MPPIFAEQKEYNARETLSYNHLTAMVLIIGVIGYMLDSNCALAIKHISWRREA